MLDTCVIIFAQEETKKEGEMPPIFKALATITVWAMWICAWIAFLFPFIFGGIMKGYLTDAAKAPIGYWLAYMIALGSGLGSGAMMLVRKKLE